MALPNVFSPGQVFSAANANLLRSNQYNQTVTNKTASYTPTTATDIGTRVIMNSASATTITINTAIYAAGDTLILSNIGVGVCTLTAGTCTITSAGPLAIPQYGGGTLYFTSTSAAIYFPTAVTVAAPAASGLTLIAKTTITSTTQIILTNVFSSAYDHYQVRFQDFVGTDGLQSRYGTSGTPDTGANYSHSGYLIDSGSIAANTYRFNATFQTLASLTKAGGNGLFVQISSPFGAFKTTYTSNLTALDTADVKSYYSAGVHNTTTSYTDLVLFTSANFTGVVSVYGMANS